MFLQQVKVKNFVQSKKVYGTPRFMPENWKGSYRELVTEENLNQEDVYHIIGITSLREGYSDFHNEGVDFVLKKSHKVYLVAKGIGRRFKVLEEDLVLLD